MAKKKATRRTTKKKTTKKAPARKASKKKVAKKKKGAVDMIISKSRPKNAASINVSGDFYVALDEAVRGLIADAEARAENNGRKTLRPHDL